MENEVDHLEIMEAIGNVGVEMDVETQDMIINTEEVVEGTTVVADEQGQEESLALAERVIFEDTETTGVEGGLGTMEQIELEGPSADAVYIEPPEENEGLSYEIEFTPHFDEAPPPPPTPSTSEIMAPPTTSDTDAKVNTKGNCFVCYKEIVNEEGDMESLSTASCQQIYFYLRINWKKIYRDLSKTKVPRWNPLDRPQLQLSLCSECRSLNERIKSLKKELEYLRKQLDSCIQSVAEKMEEAENDADKKDCFWNSMEAKEGVDLQSDDCAVVKMLRGTMISKVNRAKDQKGLFRASKLRMMLTEHLPKARSYRKRKRRKSLIAITHEEDEQLSCNFCSKTFPTGKKFRSHVIDAHSIKLPNSTRKCPYCPKEFRYNGHIMAHLTKQHRFGVDVDSPTSVLLQGNRGKKTTVIIKEGDTTLEEIRPPQYKRSKNVEVQVIEEEDSQDRHHRNREISFANVAARVFEANESLRDMRRPAPLLQRTVQINHRTECRICKKPFLTVAGLKRHYEKNHKEQAGNVLLLHRTDMNIQNKLEFQCIVCLQKFPGQISVREHEKICPLRECRICDKRFKSLEGLKFHLGDIHGNKKRCKRTR